MSRGILPDDPTITTSLIELDGIANAPMTSSQRLTRAQPVLASLALTVRDLVREVARDDLPWNENKASAFGINLRQWQESLRLSGLPEATELSGFLDAMHRADSAAAMLRAGYQAKRDDSGNITWSH